MLCFFGLKALLSYFCGCKPWKMMSEATNNLPDSSLSADESLRQWWQTRFNAPLPDDVRTFVRQLVRQETLLARRAESHLDDATLIKVRQGRRLCQTKLDNIEQALDNVRAQQQRIRHFIRLNTELDKEQKHLYEVGKRQATILSQQRELERYETFEAVNGRFQRIHTLMRTAEGLRQLKSSVSVGIEDARRATDEAEKAMVIERGKFGDMREALYRTAMSFSEAERLQMHIDDGTERHKYLIEHKMHTEQKLQRLRMELQETANAISEHDRTAQQLAVRRQTIDAHSRLIAKGAATQVMLDELATTLDTLAAVRAELTQATARRNERNEQLSRLFTQSQNLQADIQAKNEEMQGHRSSIAGQDSYTLGRRTMELRSRRQMLETGLSLWRSIAAGYDQIEQKNQIIAQQRLHAEHLNRTIDALQNDVRTLQRNLDEKTYHWTLSKSQNVIELRSDLQEGYPCTVCGATHHPWHADSVTEQNALIATMKADCDSMRGELAAKSEQLHNLQMELTATQGKLDVETDNLGMLLSRQQKDTSEWRTFSRLDNSFAECSSSTNREARTAMIRQLIEKTTIDAEEAENTLNTFNYHLNAINGLSSEVEAMQRQAAELAIRLNEVNTSCQVVVGQVERYNQRLADITQDVSRRRNAIDQIMTIPDWYHSWEQSHENMRLRIESLMTEWETLRRQSEDTQATLTSLQAQQEGLKRAIEQTEAEIAETEATDAMLTENISKDQNALERILQGYESRTMFAVARTHLEQQYDVLLQHIERYEDRLRQSVALEAQQSNLQQTGQQTDEAIAAERQELDVWMRRYNANNPPVQFAELERVLADDREWGTTRQAIRDIALEQAITQARVDNLRAEIIALQAEGLRPLVADGTEEQAHLRAEQEALEEQRRSILAQMADYERQIRTHELAARFSDDHDTTATASP